MSQSECVPLCKGDVKPVRVNLALVLRRETTAFVPQIRHAHYHRGYAGKSRYCPRTDVIGDHDHNVVLGVRTREAVGRYKCPGNVTVAEHDKENPGVLGYGGAVENGKG